MQGAALHAMLLSQAKTEVDATSLTTVQKDNLKKCMVGTGARIMFTSFPAARAHLANTRKAVKQSEIIEARAASGPIESDAGLPDGVKEAMSAYLAAYLGKLKVRTR